MTPRLRILALAFLLVGSLAFAQLTTEASSDNPQTFYSRYNNNNTWLNQHIRNVALGADATASDQLVVTTTDANTGAWKSLPNCQSTALEYNTTTHAFSCAATMVTSVGLSLPAQLTVSNSPVTSSGTLTAVWANQNANIVFAGPTTGGATTPGFRALVAADIPSLAESKITNLVSDLALLAPLASPDLTGVPTAPTAANATNTTQIATTAFVQNALSGATSPSIVQFPGAIAQGSGASLPFSTAATNYPTAAVVTGSQTPALAYGVAQFLDSEIERVQLHFTMPTGMTNVGLTVRWRSAVTNATLAAVWQVQCLGVASGSDPSSSAWSTAQTITSNANVTSNAAINANELALSCAGTVSAGSEVYVNFFRDPAHASDTLAATAELLSLSFRRY